VARAARSGTRLDFSVFAVCVGLSVMATLLPPPMREPLAGALRRTIVSPLVSMQRSAESWRAAWMEYEHLTVRRDSATLRGVDETALRLENDRLRALLGLGSRLRTGFVPAEALQQIGHPEDIVTTLTLSAGSNAGVTEYSAVVAPEGIVGIVQKVDPTMSLAIVFSHPDFRVSAMTADGSAFGIVYPRIGSGSEHYMLEMRNVLSRTALRPGTEIVSSGLGGTYPKGIDIGTVISGTKTSEGWATYLVRPSVNPAHVTSVMIITPGRALQGVANVWALSSDSAVHALTVVVDSVGRQAALADAARKRARADSLHADSVARRDSTRRPP
jgi:rod shape-determining protein MreC